MRLASLLLAFAMQQAEQPGSIEGTVTAGGEAKPGVNVSIDKLETQTNVAGKYSFRDLPAGRYTLRVGGPFLNRGGRAFRAVTVAPGQAVTADFSLIQNGSISGTLLDEFDEPIPGFEVVLLAREYSAGAPRYHRHTLSHTNDQGRYRFDFVRPDVPYILLFMPVPNVRAPAKSDAPTDPRLRRPAIVPTYFPTVNDQGGAMAVILRPGEHREGINVRALRAPSYCIEAQIPGSNVTFQIRRADITFGMGPNGGVTGNPRTVWPGADGKVRVCELAPAEYRITAFEGNSNEPLSLASSTVHILDRDATNVTLHPVPRIRVPVEFAWAGDPPAKPPEAKLQVWVNSMTRSFGAYGGTQDRAVPPAAREMNGLLMDDYHHRIYGLSGRLYVKEILYGNDNITYAPLRPGTKHDGASMRVVIGHDGAHIKARVRDRNAKPIPGATVVVMPAVFASESELASALQTGLADQYGTYESTRALPPGKYYVLALTDPIPEPLPANHVDHLINLRAHAREVTLQPGGTADLDIEPGPWRP